MSPDNPIIMTGIVAYCLLWTVSYILFIRLGFKQKTYCMPLLAICLNISWEFIFSFIYMDKNMTRTWLYRAWFIPDAFIVYQLFRYGRPEQIIPEIKKYFYPIVIFTILSCFAGIYLFVRDYHDITGTEISFLMNMVMSLSFIFFYFNRRDLKGISYAGAWTKMFGTGIASIVTHFAYPSVKPDKEPFALLELMFILIFIFDIIYIFLVAQRRKQLKDAL